jgi:enoyl-CoA hydratase/carnithine racemase
VVAETARIICENAPLTIAGIKAIARELGKPAAARDLAKLERFVEACFTSHDFAEGRRAFMEKRKPDFSGT